MGRRPVVAVFAALAAALVASAPVAAQEAPPDRVVTYTVETRGPVVSDPDVFRAVAAATLNDPRGWSLGGAIRFDEVPALGQFRLVLATPDQVAAADPSCEVEWSCRVGDDVLINEDRWRLGSLGYLRPIWEYRAYLVNHEVGHWLGLGHTMCASGPAPVMVQQSKGTGECTTTVWPLEDELAQVAYRFGAPARITPVLQALARTVASGVRFPG